MSFNLVNGTSTTINGNNLYRFTTSGSITFPANVATQVLIVGGGGGGGGGFVNQQGVGGGGGGGVGVGTLTFLAGQTYNITVGNGGSGGIGGSSTVTVANNGENSSIIGSSINEVAYGGGAGASGYAGSQYYGKDGGSGGGSSEMYSQAVYRGNGTK